VRRLVWFANVLFCAVAFSIFSVCLYIAIILLSSVAVSFFTMNANVLQLQEVGDFEAQNFLPALNLIRSTKLHLTTEPPISCSCCYALAVLVSG